MGQFLLLPTKMLLLLSCLAATAFASPLQFERVPSLDNRIPLLVQDRVPNPCLTKANDTSQFSNCPEDTPDLPSCTAESGASCVFPFRHLGITYTSCASTDLLSSAWCSTSTHENGTHILGTESVCSSSCPGATATTTTTTTTSITTTASTSTTTTTTVSTTTTASTTTASTTTASTTTAAADIKRS